MSKVRNGVLIIGLCLFVACCLLSIRGTQHQSKNVRPSLEPVSQEIKPNRASKTNEFQNNRSSILSSRREKLIQWHSQHMKEILANRSKTAASPSAVPLSSQNVGEEGCIKIGNFSKFTSTDVWKTFQTLLENYTQFHKDGIERMKRSDHSVRTLTWSCYKPKSCSGTGDQFSRIKQVFLLALMSRRVFTIYWDNESLKTMHYLQPNKIDWSYFDEDAGMHIGHDKEVTKGYFRMYDALMDLNQTHLTMNEDLRVPLYKSFSKMFRFCETISKKMANIGISEVLDGKQYPQLFVLGEIIRYLFKFSPEIIHAVNAVERFLGIHKDPYLAVHIRTGFLGTAYEEGGRKFPKHKIYRDTRDWESTLNCSIDKATKSLGPNATVFLATDSYLVKQLAAEKYSSRVRQINGTLQHVAHIKQDVQQKGNFSISDIDGYMSTWIDFLLLARSSVLVHPISMFSNLAAEYCSISEHYYVPRCTINVPNK